MESGPQVPWAAGGLRLSARGTELFLVTEALLPQWKFRVQGGFQRGRVECVPMHGCVGMPEQGFSALWVQRGGSPDCCHHTPGGGWPASWLGTWRMAGACHRLPS